MGDSAVAAPDIGDPVAAGGAVGTGTAVEIGNGSVAGGAGVAGTDVETCVATGSPPPQAARKRARRIRVKTKVASGNPGRLTVERIGSPLQRRWTVAEAEHRIERQGAIRPTLRHSMKDAGRPSVQLQRDG